MNTEEKIEAAGKKKEEGNVLFKSGKYARASKRYEKVIQFVVATHSSFHLRTFESFLLLNILAGSKIH